jgi:hypothetical protein
LALTAANPLPTSGLDPGSLASAAIGQNQAQNQFALDKTGALTNVYQSGANSNAAMLGNIAGAANLFSKGFNIPSVGGAPKTAGYLPPASTLAFNTNIPTTFGKQ